MLIPKESEARGRVENEDLVISFSKFSLNLNVAENEKIASTTLLRYILKSSTVFNCVAPSTFHEGQKMPATIVKLLRWLARSTWLHTNLVGKG